MFQFKCNLKLIKLVFSYILMFYLKKRRIKNITYVIYSQKDSSTNVRISLWTAVHT